MTQYEEALSEQLHRLELRVEALERSALEGHARPPEAAPEAPPAPEPAFTMPDIVPALGRAILGLAGAYILRALAEAGAAPNRFVVALAIGYAAAWLWFAARAVPLNAVVCRVTSALILSPLLWEAGVRFHVLPNAIAAAVLFAYAVFGANPIPQVCAVATALALMVGTADTAPFATALLATSVLLPRTILAASTGVALVALIAARNPENYRSVPLPLALALCAALFLIAAFHVVRRSAAAGEMVQSGLAASVAMASAMKLTQGHAGLAIGVVCALACAGCYRVAQRPGFAHVGAVFGLLACFQALPVSMVVPALCAAALATRKSAFHGALFLLAAGVAAAMHRDALSPVYVACAASVSYALSRKTVLDIVPAVVAALAIGAMLFPYLNIAIIVSAFALAFAFAGHRYARPEMQWAAWAAAALGSLRLLLVDFRGGTPARLAVALFCYGGILLILPRLRFNNRN